MVHCSSIHWSTFGFRLVCAGDSTARIRGQRITDSSGHMCGLEIIEEEKTAYKVQRQRCDVSDVAIDISYISYISWYSQ